MLKRILVVLTLIFLGSIAAYIVYLEEVRYSLPTPLPAGYTNIAVDTYISPPSPMLAVKGKPLFIHFFNPHCPCSRFNLEHFNTLVLTFSNKVDFAVVLQVEKEDAVAKFKKMKLNLPFVEDTNGRIAEKYGVYSTPQAVIMNKEGKLHYRGNYNKARYCSLKSSEYARFALEALLRDEKMGELPIYAKIAYGCQLPTENLNQRRNEFLDELFSIF
ncbi:MAG TPA: redoxin domain-containing protein [Leptospiraceae bacterium]|nr:redoxin domain-containing protein [Leptospiraceae bacterium]HRG75036.1 redoxin domain-containing protein [Leptospiraceae bacterium]